MNVSLPIPEYVQLPVEISLSLTLWILCIDLNQTLVWSSFICCVSYNVTSPDKLIMTNSACFCIIDSIHAKYWYMHIIDTNTVTQFSNYIQHNSFFYTDLPIMRCLNAYSQDIQVFGRFSPPFFSFFRPACPCSRLQAQLDGQYSVFSIDFTDGIICYARIFSFFSNSMCCYSFSFFSPFLWVLCLFNMSIIISNIPYVK